MKVETAAWVAKAEADFISARRELRARRDPNYDAVCFHSQQCGEKYLKARLVEAGAAFPKIHSLTALLHMILPLEPEWASLKPEAAQLTAYAVEFRYPGKTADKPLAQEAFAQSRRIRENVRASLGLVAPPPRRTAAKAVRRPRRPTGSHLRRTRK